MRCLLSGSGPDPAEDTAASWRGRARRAKSAIKPLRSVKSVKSVRICGRNLWSHDPGYNLPVRVLFVLVLTSALVGHAQVEQTPLPPAGCAPDLAQADADLYCIELLPAADIERGSGTARLVQPSTPFGIAVSASGQMQYSIVFTLRDLPDLDSLGPYTTFVAWATTPQLRPLTKLGVVTDGTSRLGLVDYDRFLIMITAERSADAVEPTGRMVLRGTSAAVRMQPHDMAFLLSGLIEQKDSLPAAARACGARHARGVVTGRLDTAADASRGVDASRVHELEAGRVVVPASRRRQRTSRTTARAVTVEGRRSTGARRRTRAPRAVWPHGDDARVQRSVSGSAHRGRRGLDDRRQIHQSHGLPDGRPLAWPAAGKSLRRRAARHAGSGGAGRLVRIPRVFS